MKLIILLLGLLLSFEGMAQKEVSVYGFIRDHVTGEALIGATVYDVNGGRGAVSNAYGYYVLKCDVDDTLNIRVSFVGYEHEYVTLFATGSQEHIFRLSPGKSIDEVMVRGYISGKNAGEMSSHVLSVSDVKRLPAMFGEVDILKTLHLLPGVQSGEEGSSGFFVRGGSNDQNLILFDGVPLYYVNHLGGLVSIFNPDAINNIEIIKGGFPARYGNRLSSVLDVRMKDGNYSDHKVNGTIGMITTKLCVEGPVKIDTSSYLISVRRFMYDLITRPVTKLAFDGVSMGYMFYDVNFKINHAFSNSNRIFFSFYMGDDASTVKIKKPNLDISKASHKVKWGNVLASLRWNHVAASNLFGNTSLYYTRYRFHNESKQSGRSQLLEEIFSSSIEDVGLQTDWDFSLSQKYKLVFGAGAVFHQFEPSVQKTVKEYNNESSNEKTYGYAPKAKEINGYVENHFYLGQRVKLNVGLRGMVWQMTDTLFTYIEPRFLLSTRLSHRAMAKVSYSEMVQPVHLLVNETASMPIDYWIPATAKLAPQYSRQVALGVDLNSKGGDFLYLGEVYYKEMENLVSFAEGVRFLSDDEDWQQFIEGNGVGDSYGLELIAEKKTGMITGWASYTLSKSSRQFADQNKGNPYPFKYDRRHNFSATAMFRINERIDLGASWVFYTGHALTLPTARFAAISDNDNYGDSDANMALYDAHYYGGKNSFRMPNYHRLDVGVNLHKQKKWGERVWNFSIYNVYMKQNPFFIYWGKKQQRGFKTPGEATVESPALYKYSLFPFVPSVSYSFKF